MITTTQEVLNRYGIKMYNRIRNGPPDSPKIYNKSFYGGDYLESFFDLTNKDPKDIEEALLPKINYILNGNTPPLNHIECELGGLDGFAIIHDREVLFYSRPDTIKQIVPLSDFKIIAEAWKNFLLEPPLIGTLVDPAETQNLSEKDILKKYKVTFNASKKFIFIYKIGTVNDWLSLFVNEHYYLGEAERILSGIIALTDQDLPTEFETQGLILAIATTHFTKIYQYADDYYDDTTIKPDFEIPTADLKVILKAWRDYIKWHPRWLYSFGKWR